MEQHNHKIGDPGIMITESEEAFLVSLSLLLPTSFLTP